MSAAIESNRRIQLPCIDCGDELLAELVYLDKEWKLCIRRLRKGKSHIGVWTLESLVKKTENNAG